MANSASSPRTNARSRCGAARRTRWRSRMERTDGPHVERAGSDRARDWVDVDVGHDLEVDAADLVQEAGGRVLRAAVRADDLKEAAA